MIQSSDQASPLQVRLFGQLEVKVSGAPLPHLRSKKGLWLLAILVLKHKNGVERTWLAEKLWPDSLESAALANLRLNLSDLRKALGDEAKRITYPTPRTIRFDISGVDADALEFDSKIGGDSEAKRHAIALYRAELLRGCLEDWATEERNLREEAYLAALTALAEEAHLQGNIEAEINSLRKILQVDPYREPILREIMNAHSKRGDTAAIRSVYRDFRIRSLNELKSELHPDTAALYSRLTAKNQSGKVAPAPAFRKEDPAISALPSPLTKLIGREIEIENVCEAFRSVRLLTLKGTGGIGKTRLSLAVGETLSDEFASDVWFVDLSPLSPFSLTVAISQTVATVLGVREATGKTLLRTLKDHLQTRRVLLILDNCEHLLSPCAELAEYLLNSCPHLKIIATSRQPLGLTGEVVWNVASLALPVGGDAELIAAEDGSLPIKYAAIRLFVERASDVAPGFRANPQTLLGVAEICRRLDGIPLAIELAAAWARALPISQIVQNLDDRFALLTGRNLASLPRQQTMRATLQWSHDLLSEEKRTLLSRLSVFSGGWTLEAAEAICSETQELVSKAHVIRSQPIYDLLAGLVDASLIYYEELSDSSGRYRLSETVRDYALELLDADQKRALRQRHATYFVEMISSLKTHYQTDSTREFNLRIERDLDNILSAFDWSWAEGDRKTAGSSLSILNGFWYTRGYAGVGRRQIEAALEHSDDLDPHAVGALMSGMGTLLYVQGDHASAQEYHTLSLNQFRILGNKAFMAYALNDLAGIASCRREYPLADGYLAESLSLFRETGLQDGVTYTLILLGRMQSERGEFEKAIKTLEEAKENAIRNKLKEYTAFTLESLGYCLNGLLRYDEAKVILNQALTMRIQQGHRPGMAISLANLGLCHLYLNEKKEALANWEEARTIWTEQGDEASILLFKDQFSKI